MLGEGGVNSAKACQGLVHLYQQDTMDPSPHLICMQLDELNGCLLKRGAKKKRWDPVDQTTQKREERGSEGEGFVAQ